MNEYVELPNGWLGHEMEFSRLREAFDNARRELNSAHYHAGVRTAVQRAEAAEAKLAKAREALEFYANPEIYKPHPHGLAFDRRDLSFSARAVLAELDALPSEE